MSKFVGSSLVIHGTRASEIALVEAYLWTDGGF